MEKMYHSESRFFLGWLGKGGGQRRQFIIQNPLESKRNTGTHTARKGEEERKNIMQNDAIFFLLLGSSSCSKKKLPPGFSMRAWESNFPRRRKNMVHTWVEGSRIEKQWILGPVCRCVWMGGWVWIDGDWPQIDPAHPRLLASSQYHTPIHTHTRGIEGAKRGQWIECVSERETESGKKKWSQGPPSKNWDVVRLHVRE